MNSANTRDAYVSAESEIISHELRFRERLSSSLYIFFSLSVSLSLSHSAVTLLCSLLLDGRISSSVSKTRIYFFFLFYYLGRGTYILFLFHNFFTRVVFFSFALRIYDAGNGPTKSSHPARTTRELSIHRRARVVINFCVRLPRDGDIERARETPSQSE